MMIKRWEREDGLVNLETNISPVDAIDILKYVQCLGRRFAVPYFSSDGFNAKLAAVHELKPMPQAAAETWCYLNLHDAWPLSAWCV
jgi:hypothetical protein